MCIVGALEQVGGFKGVSGCIGVKCKLILRSKLGCEDGVGEGTLGSGDALEMHLGWVDGPRAEEMRARWVQVKKE